MSRRQSRTSLQTPPCPRFERPHLFVAIPSVAALWRSLRRTSWPSAPAPSPFCLTLLLSLTPAFSPGEREPKQWNPLPTGGGLGEGRDHSHRFNFALQNRTWLRGSLFPVPELVFQEPAVARSLWRRIVSQRRILPPCLSRASTATVHRNRAQLCERWQVGRGSA